MLEQCLSWEVTVRLLVLSFAVLGTWASHVSRTQELLDLLSKLQRKTEYVPDAERLRMAWLMVDCAYHHRHNPALHPFYCAYFIMYGSRPEIIERKLAEFRRFMWGGEIPEPNLPDIQPQRDGCLTAVPTRAVASEELPLSVPKKPAAAVRDLAAKAGAR